MSYNTPIPILIVKNPRLRFAKRIRKPQPKRALNVGSTYESLPLPVQRIIDYVTANTTVSPSDVLEKVRQGDMVNARHIAIYLCLQHINTTTIEVGKWFNCDHSSAVHARNKIADYLTYDKALQRRIKIILECL